MSIYNSTATNIDSGVSSINSSLDKVKGVSFDGIWNGPAHDSLTASLQDVIKNADNILDDLSRLSQVLTKVEKYKKLKEEIEALDKEIDSIVIPADKEGAAAAYNRKKNLIAKRNNLIAQKNLLRKEIESLLSTFKEIESKLELITFDISEYNDYLDFIVDIDELLALYKNNKIDEIPGDGLTITEKLGELYDSTDENGNIIKGSGLKYIENQLLEIQSKYSGREAAVNSALLILQLAADKGVKIEYDSHGTSSKEPYVKTETLLEGIDCNPFTSWVVDKGTPGGFQWRPVPGFESVGTILEDWTQAQPGDVFVVVTDRKNGFGHVGVIIENNPTTGTFITAEAANPSEGIVLKTQTYTGLKQSGYRIQDMTGVYDGTDNTNRSVFDPIINKEGFDRGI